MNILITEGEMMNVDEVRLLVGVLMEHLRVHHGLDAMVKADAYLADLERLVVAVDGRDIFRTEAPVTSDFDATFRGGFHPVKH